MLLNDKVIIVHDDADACLLIKFLFFIEYI